jgi:hypothetical protein
MTTTTPVAPPISEESFGAAGLLLLGSGALMFFALRRQPAS